MAWKLKQSLRCEKLIALPGSDAIGTIAERVPGDAADPDFVVEIAKKLKIDLVVVGPEAPLAAGVADALKAAHIRCFGPGKAAAQLEASKAFAKDFMKRHHIPAAESRVFVDAAKAQDAVEKGPLPVVIKADGLAAGKGVRVCHSRPDAVAAVRDFMVDRSLGASGARVVVEEFLEGPELTVLCLCDGKTLRALPFSRDHKRLKDRDEGPNTGGMGSMAPVEVDRETGERIRKEVLDRVIAALQADKLDYRGVLYVGLMLTKDGPKVLEFNARFGDPETQAVLPLIDSDLVELMEACVDGQLEKARLQLSKRHAVSIVLASEGYPNKPHTGRKIEGLDAVAENEAVVFHAGTIHDHGAWKTAGGRVLSVTALGDSLEQAREKAYAAAAKIRFDGMQWRKDIAKGPALAARG